jgi:uncharacterized membrane protein YccC
MAEFKAALLVPRHAARVLFRHHLENGFAVALCLAVVGVVAGSLLGIDDAVLVGTGALCVSVVDQPGPLTRKPLTFLITIIATSAISLVAGLAGGSVWMLAAVIVAMSVGFAMVTAYGRSALVIGIAGVLALVLGMAIPVGNTAEVLFRGALFAAGAAGYGLIAFAGAWLLDDRVRRLFLNEALRAFAQYLQVRARLYDADTPIPAALRNVIEAHGALMERMQAARDAIFTGRPTPQRRRWIAGMLALLDVYEAVLSSDADWETLRQTAPREALECFAALTRDMALTIKGLALALIVPGVATPENRHAAALETIDAEFASHASRTTASWRTTRDAFVEAIRHIGPLVAIVSGGDPVAPAPPIDLAAFVQAQDTRFATLRAQLTLTSPVMRYAIRLTLAMLTGYALTIAMPSYVHGGWILLTIALIMRASFAVTRQRRNDRIVGTLAGCAAAALLIPILPQIGVLTVIIVAAGIAHAYAVVNYRMTSFAASVMALLLVHMLDPTTILVSDRIVDTLIGAALSVAFSYLLPSWEWRDVPGLITRLIGADRGFAAEALLADPADQQYRLARKRALDSFTALVTTARRLSGEPGVHQRQLAGLNALLSANYLLASDLAAVQGLLRSRGREIKSEDARALLEPARGRVLEILTLKSTTPPPPTKLRRRGWTEMPASHALTFLGRRLRHVEYAVQRLAALAAHVLQPDQA